MEQGIIAAISPENVRSFCLDGSGVEITDFTCLFTHALSTNYWREEEANEQMCGVKNGRNQLFREVNNLARLLKKTSTCIEISQETSNNLFVLFCFSYLILKKKKKKDLESTFLIKIFKAAFIHIWAIL